MRLAFVGTRGIPAGYSGFETCVEQLGQRLVKRGHEVTVYCRSHHITYREPTYLGMRLVRLPTVQNKYLDTILHTVLSLLHAMTQRYDLIMMFIVGNAPAAIIPRLRGQKVILNVDGLDWKRDKWPQFAKSYIQITEYLATKIPHAFITDSRIVQQYYRERYKAESPYIPYGSNVHAREAGPWLEQYGLTPRQYVLFVGRLVPDNKVHHLVEAFNGLDTDMKCVIVGGAAYADEYVQHLRSIAGPRVIFTGYVFGDGYAELSSHAYLFVETSSVGGTHPALIEAMAFGNCVVVNNTAENLESIGDAGFWYDGIVGSVSLHDTLSELLHSPDRVEQYRQLAKQRAETCYDWDRVTDEYEALFMSTLAKRKTRP